MSKDRKGTHARKLPKEVDNSFFSFIPKEKRKLAGIIALCVLAVVAVLIVLNALDLLRLDGHLRFFNGKVYADPDVITANVGTRDDPKYVSAGRFAGTDKYAFDGSFKLDSTGVRSEWKYDGVKADPIYLMQVYGLDESAKTAYDTTITAFNVTDSEGNTSFAGVNGEDTNAAGLKYYWFSTQALPIPERVLMAMGMVYTDYYETYALAFIETGDETCAVVGVAGRGDQEADAPDSDTLLLRVRELANLVYAEQPEGVAAEPMLVYADETRQGDAITAGYYAGTDRYTLSADQSGSDRYTTWVYEGTQADQIYFMYVGGRAAPAKEAYEQVRDSYLTTNEEDGTTSFTGTEKEGVNANGVKYYWMVTEPQSIPYNDLYQQTGLSYPDYYVKYSYAYLETDDDVSAHIAVYAKSETRTNMVDDEAIFERSLEFIDLISKD